MALLAFSLLSRFHLTVAAIFLLASVFWYAYFPTFSKNQVVKSTEKTMARGQLTSLFDEVQLEFDAISVKEMTTQGTHINNWQDIESIRITKEYFYLFLTSTSAIIIPKRTLALEEMDELKGLIDKYYQGNIEQIDK